ncbi:MAG TPA: hypothetical protein VKA08_16430 [Balneolales bacterium]|nr:hypothetical protein [Balneolales bacterium]
MKAWFMEFWSRQGERIFWLASAYIMSVQFILLGNHISGDVGAGLIGAGVAGLTGIHAILLTRARSQDPESKTLPSAKEPAE